MYSTQSDFKRDAERQRFEYFRSKNALDMHIELGKPFGLSFLKSVAIGGLIAWIIIILLIVYQNYV
jgi:hypothetical protein